VELQDVDRDAVEHGGDRASSASTNRPTRCTPEARRRGRRPARGSARVGSAIEYEAE
jgi:hypothetical protein